MTVNGFDAASDARFRATIENEQKHLWRQIELLWDHNRKRRSEIEEVKKLIYGALVAFAGAAAGLAFLLLKTKIGL
jgi:hypothetical protein